MFPCWHPCRQPWPLASRFVVLANPCVLCDTCACCCCGCCWGIVFWKSGGTFPSGVCPSIPDLCDPTALCLLCWLGVPGTGGNPALPQPPFPSPLSAIPGLGQPCTPWLPGSIPTTPLRAASRQLRYHVEGSLTFETSRPDWVSVQDVVLKKQKTVHANQVNQSQSSATFTAHRQATKEISLPLSLYFLLTCHFLTQNRCGVTDIFLSTSQKKTIKNTCRHKKSFTSRYGLFVQISLSVWKTLKHFKH